MKKIKTYDQNEIAYMDQGQGIPIIFIHGLDGNLAAFYQTSEQLSNQYRTIIYDVRGHGKSSHPNSYTLSDHLEDLNSLIKALNIEKFHIVGHDMGGLIARAFTENYQDSVLSLTIISSKVEDIVHGFTKLMIEHQDKIVGFNKSEAMIILFPYIFREQDNTMKWFQQQRLYSKASSEDSAAASRALLTTSRRFNQFTSNVDVPTLIINGVYDPIIEDKENFKIESYYSNIRKELFEQSGHAPHIEESQKFIKILKEFIQDKT